MTDKNKPTELDDADLDVAGGVSPDMMIKSASTPGSLDGVRANGIRWPGVDEDRVRKNGVRLTGVRDNGIRKKG